MRTFALLIPLMFAVACSSSNSKGDSGSQDSTAQGTDTATQVDPAVSEALKDKVKITFFGKSLYLDDELYKSSCNEFFFSFWTDKSHPDCVATKAEADIKIGEGDAPTTYAWTVKSPNGQINLTGSQVQGDEKIEFNGKQYFCLLYEGSAYDHTTGDELFSASHIVLSETAITKPSEFDETKAFGIAIDDQDLCDLRF